MKDKHFYVYILASRIGGTLYIGVTNDLIRRVWEHREKSVEGFTRKHDVHRLVYLEQFDDIENAIRREKRLKKWNRNWKIRLIEEKNPNWNDLFESLISIQPSSPRRRGTSIPRGLWLNTIVTAYWIARSQARRRALAGR